MPPSFASLKYYWDQSTDEIIMLAVLAPVVALGISSGRRAWVWIASLTGVAGVYLALLLTFRHQVSYYVYVPAVLTAIAFAIAFPQVSRGYQIVMVLALILSRVHSIPYIYFQAAAQRYADFVNFNAMELAAGTGGPRVIILDVDERNQMIQEWNILRQYFLDGRVPPIIGGPPEFKYGTISSTSAATRRKTYPWVRGPTWVDGVDLPPDQFNAEPRVGDVVAFRSGTMLARRTRVARHSAVHSGRDLACSSPSTSNRSSPPGWWEGNFPVSRPGDGVSRNSITDGISSASPRSRAI